jgi:hypothetical protein
VRGREALKPRVVGVYAILVYSGVVHSGFLSLWAGSRGVR